MDTSGKMWQMLASELKITASCFIGAWWWYAGFQILPEAWLLNVNTTVGHKLWSKELADFLWLPGYTALYVGILQKEWEDTSAQKPGPSKVRCSFWGECLWQLRIGFYWLKLALSVHQSPYRESLVLWYFLNLPSHWYLTLTTLLKRQRLGLVNCGIPRIQRRIGKLKMPEAWAGIGGGGFPELELEVPYEVDRISATLMLKGQSPWVEQKVLPCVLCCHRDLSHPFPTEAGEMAQWSRALTAV